MEEEGIVRNLDSLGRVVIPKEIRKLLNMKNGDAVRIIKENNEVIIKRYEKSCALCGSRINLIQHQGSCVCRECVRSLKSQV